MKKLIINCIGFSKHREIAIIPFQMHLLRIKIEKERERERKKKEVPTFSAAYTFQHRTVD